MSCLCWYHAFFLQVGTNGIISFTQSFTHHVPSIFPSDLTFISSAFLLAPFWSDVDVTVYGSIFYEVHSSSNNSLVSEVNHFISNQTETNFTGTWMLVVQWDEVRQFPGFLNIPVSTSPPITVYHSKHCSCLQTNTFQAIAITDGSQSYAIYTYRCGQLLWPGGATIGFNGGAVGDFYANHPLSGNSANSIACINSDVTEWSNVLYNISIDVYITTDPPPTIEPCKCIEMQQMFYLKLCQ